ncbi:MAG: adenylosuccinate lyase [Candidatus Goldiibacteriota bacterium HGW-Goldbacteria-1]|nr:MAG: adenylosuccinate lyase [Candidatus Goldiibacteriota bacterium HGW-Goldbacteria-1]
MIARYTRPQMGALWTEDAKYQSWLDLEVAVCQAWAKKGKIPKKDMASIKKNAAYNVKQIEKIEGVVRHDVIAFLTSVSKHVGASSRYVHMGMTSSDLVDSAMALRMVKACDIIIEGQKKLIAALKKLAVKHKYTVMIGRSHNIHAEPITFGLKVLVWYFEGKRNLERLIDAKEEIRVGKISGAVGNYANIDPAIELDALTRVGLKRAEIANQIIQRDRYAALMNAMAVAAASIEKITVNLRLMQHSEILETEEPFAKGQKGSSAMPHKRNPVVCENLSGLARIVRTNALAAMENIALWHERDISHSSVERIAVPDSFILMDYMLSKCTWIIENLSVFPKNMIRNMNHLKGLVFSQQVLLTLISKGISREDAYKIVQTNAMKIWAGDPEDFKTKLLNDEKVVSKMTKAEIEGIFNVDYYLKNVEEFYKRM